MVYCGKPSKACGECRLRRTRCDYKKPSCSQCTRAGRTCKGYRDTNELMFRDESQNQSDKHQRLKATRKARANDLLSSAAIDANFDIMTTQMKPLPIEFPILSPFIGGTSAEDQATCFFFQNYILGGNDLSKGNFDYLSDIYGSEEIGSGLADSVAALGMVGLANFWRAPNIMRNANVKYHSALRTVSSQLMDVEQAKSDQTLISIMLLGLFEINTCSSRQSMEAWTKHITGAASLLELRGIDQLRTPMGHHLFIHLRTQVITNCIQRHAPIPPIISEWSKELDFESPEQATATALSELAIKYCNLRASMSSFHDYSDPEHVITTALAIDAEYESWGKTCPLQFIYQTVTLRQRSEEVFSDHYHVYNNLWIATVWNNYRSVRILLHEILLDQLCHLYLNNPESSLLWNDLNFFENQVLASNSILLQLCHDICASVPYYLGFDPNADIFSPRQVPKAVAGNLLLWPLYIAGCTDLVSDMMRDWAGGRLRWISDVIGIRQAAPLAFSMKRKQDLLTWQNETEDDETPNISPISSIISGSEL